MIKEIFGKSRRPLSEILLESISELGKHYSRLELLYLKLAKRDKELFEECASYLSRGMKNRAIIYANEIAEIRKIMSFIQRIQLSIEKAILRLETLKAVTPTIEEVKSVFSEVKDALGDIAKLMPSLTPELNSLVNSINELMAVTEINITVQEPTVIKDEATESILKEASEFLRQEIERKMPEPPIEIPEPPREIALKPRIALTVDGSEFYVDANGSIIGERDSSSNALAEEIILDYIERNNGEMNVSKCAKELNMSPARIMTVLESLNKKGKIKIE